MIGPLGLIDGRMKFCHLFFPLLEAFIATAINGEVVAVACFSPVGAEAFTTSRTVQVH